MGIARPIKSTEGAKEVGKLIRNYYARAREVQQKGWKTAWCMHGVPDELLLAMGVFPSYPENYATVCASKQVATNLIELAEGDGFSRDLCAYIRICFGYAKEMQKAGGIPPDSPFGGMPLPDMLISISRVCDPRVKIFEAMRRYLPVPTYIYDAIRPPIDDPKCIDPDLARPYLDYNVEQLKGLVAFLEEQTGNRLDEDRLRELVSNALETHRLFYEVLQTRKSVPCPMASTDYFAIIFPFMWMAGEREAVDFYRNLLEEVRGRAKSKVGVIPEEKYRLLWVGLPPYFDTGLFNYLEEHGAVSVCETQYYPGKPVDISLHDPLRALVAKLYLAYDMKDADGSEVRCGLAAGNLVFNFIRDYKIDGVIFHEVRSCRASTLGFRHTAKIVRERLDLPVLHIESDMADPAAYSPEQVRNSIDAFIEVLRRKKQAP